jgi:hypothetical protein
MVRSIVCLAIAIMMAAGLNAQTTFGVRAGVNFNNVNGRNEDDEKIMGKLRTAFHAGANVEFAVAEDFYLQPGVLFSMKGAKTNGSEFPFDLNISYIEIPVNFIYKPDLGTGRMLLGFGPYLAIGLDANYKIGGTTVDFEFGDELGELKRIDAGANLLVGYELANNFSFQLNAQLGLVNIGNRPPGDNNSKFNHTGFGLSFGYRFGGTKK